MGDTAHLVKLLRTSPIEFHGQAADRLEQLDAALRDVIDRAMNDPDDGTRLFGCGAAEHYRELLPALDLADAEAAEGPG